MPGCGQMRLAATVDYSSKVLCERCTLEKKAQIYQKDAAVASQLLNEW